MMHSSTFTASTFARLTASRTAIAPNCTALKSDSEPWNLPTGVRTPEMMTTSESLYDDISCPSQMAAMYSQQPYIIRCRWHLNRLGKPLMDEQASAVAPATSNLPQPAGPSGFKPVASYLHTGLIVILMAAVSY